MAHLTRDDALNLSLRACDTTVAVDFAFLAAQTFDDRALQAEVLDLFVMQARRLLPGLPTLDARAQGDVAHLLKGSARGIGAWAVAAAAESYEAADPTGRPAAHARLARALAEAEAVIASRATI